MKKLYSLILLILFANYWANCQNESILVDFKQKLVLTKNLNTNNLILKDSSSIIIREVDTLTIKANIMEIGNGCKIILEGRVGKDSVNGLNGGNSPNLILKAFINQIGSLSINSIGGRGGNGGNGINGKAGRKSKNGFLPTDCERGPGDGTNGGNGGDAGIGGNGGSADLFYNAPSEIVDKIIDKISFQSNHGLPGLPGQYGKGGKRGDTTSKCKDDGRDGKDGKAGTVKQVQYKTGELNYLRIKSSNDCLEEIKTFLLVISAYDNEEDAFFKIKNQLVSKLDEKIKINAFEVWENRSANQILTGLTDLMNGNLEFIDEENEHSQLLIVFIGHGAFNDDTKSFYFVTDREVSKKILFDDIITRIERSPFKHILTILNACSSGFVIDNPYQGQKINGYKVKKLDDAITNLSCYGKSRHYITSTFNTETSSQTDLLDALIKRINSLSKNETIDNIYFEMMSAEGGLNFARPILGKSSITNNYSNFIFIKK